jgi:hypothetical protein
VVKVEEPKEKPADDRLASILKNVDKLKTEPRKETQTTQTANVAPEPQGSMIEQMALVRTIQTQMRRCWRLEPGARDAEDLVVAIQVSLNQDGSVRRAAIVDEARVRSDPYFRSAAENALRAIHKCSPFEGLPLQKYALWRDMKLTFNPSEMFGS